eukprot:4810246-Lingulodinium_polyedra.AAC.1
MSVLLRKRKQEARVSSLGKAARWSARTDRRAACCSLAAGGGRQAVFAARRSFRAEGGRPRRGARD